MKSMMLATLWNDFSNWVSEWGNTIFIIVVCIFAILGLSAFLSFFKKSINKDKRPKWGMLILAIIMFAIFTVLCCAKIPGT